MTMILEAISIPLTNDGDGGFRVGNSRVQLERIVAARAQGASAEEIVRMYDTLDLADVHAVVAWMLKHPEDVAAYMKRRNAEADELWRQMEADGFARRLTHEDLERMKSRKENPPHVPSPE